MLLNEQQGTKCSIFTIQGIVISYMYLYKIDCIEAETVRRDGRPFAWFFCGVGVFLWILNTYSLIVVNMQSVQYVSYSLLELTASTYKVCTKGHQNNPQTPRILSRQDRARTVLKFLDPPLRGTISPKLDVWSCKCSRYVMVMISYE